MNTVCFKFLHIFLSNRKKSDSQSYLNKLYIFYSHSKFMYKIIDYVILKLSSYIIIILTILKFRCTKLCQGT